MNWASNDRLKRNGLPPPSSARALRQPALVSSLSPPPCLLSLLPAAPSADFTGLMSSGSANSEPNRRSKSTESSDLSSSHETSTWEPRNLCLALESASRRASLQEQQIKDLEASPRLRDSCPRRAIHVLSGPSHVSPSCGCPRRGSPTSFFGRLAGLTPRRTQLCSRASPLILADISVVFIEQTLARP
ncbi:hypothetical protein BC628DRAFT_863188 [Trametes gibbosa]|nr:hypothetical protein BC628DRAFT_863188 [Trametes gibbosa]